MIIIAAWLLTASAADQLPAAPPDSVYATSALRAMVARAATENRVPPPALASYTARVESEIGVLLSQPSSAFGGVSGPGDLETPVQLEQIASDVRWLRSGRYEQRVIGYRSRTQGFNISLLSLFRRPWTTPVLYGDRITMFFGGDTVFAAGDTAGRQRMAETGYRGVHPFASDRDEVYRFTGGDTVATLETNGRMVRVARIHVEPRVAPRTRMVLFSGDVDIDAERAQIVRLRGRFVLFDTKSSLKARVLRAVTQIRGVALVEVVNAEVDGKYWLPSFERTEFLATSPFSDGRSVVRLVSRFHDHRLNTIVISSSASDSVSAVIALAAAGDSTAPQQFRLTSAPRDSISRFTRWPDDIGVQTAAVSAHDFDDLLPSSMRPTGGPDLSIHAPRFDQFFRYNRIEGAYTGLAATLRLRDAAPGLMLRANAGWAWEERTARGGLDLSLKRGRWLATAAAERTLANTEDFSSFGSSGLNSFSALFGRDDADYVDRGRATLGLTRALDQRARLAVRVEAGWGSDRPERRRILRAGIGRDTFRLNRPVARGDYALTGVTLQYGGTLGERALGRGLGALLRYERGDGGLRWQRLDARALGTADLGALTLASRLDAGVLVSSAPPPQQLFEMGDAEGLPGYAYKQFAGDRALLGRVSAAYTLPILGTPIRVWRLVLPAVAPAPTIGLSAGWTGASRDGQRVLDRYAWRTTGRPRATVDVGLRMFGGGVTIGVARAIDQREPWRLVIGR